MSESFTPKSMRKLKKTKATGQYLIRFDKAQHLKIKEKLELIANNLGVSPTSIIQQVAENYITKFRIKGEF
ncbi:MAG: hypothetical protein PHN88_16265 [Ignavibacteria bacterium]|nr:hypothetical protein [Ignavibacteria bacterium]